MSDIDNEAEVLETELHNIVAKLETGDGLTNSEGETLLRLLGGVNVNLTLSNELIRFISEQLPDMVDGLTTRVMLRCGRTDEKAKRSVKKISGEYIDMLWTAVRLHAAEVSNVIQRNINGENADTDTVEEN